MNIVDPQLNLSSVHVFTIMTITVYDNLQSMCFNANAMDHEALITLIIAKMAPRANKGDIYKPLLDVSE